MILDPAHLVGIGGMIGAVLRLQVGRLVEAEAIPLDTLTVNVIGSFVLGAVTFLSADAATLLLIGTGACGAFTTFSSFAYETVRLWETDRRVASAAYALANVVGSVAAVLLARIVVEVG